MRLASRKRLRFGAEGFYCFSSLQLGPYTVSAESGSFKKAVKKHAAVRAE
jgi:hypothetical protein